MVGGQLTVSTRREYARRLQRVARLPTRCRAVGVLPTVVALVALTLLRLGVLPRPHGPAWASAGARCRLVARQALLGSEPEGLQSKASLDLLKAQTKAGYALKDLGRKLEETHFKASALDGHITVEYDGTQRLRKLDVADDVLEVAGGQREEVEKALLGALQEAHDASSSGTKDDVWDTYRTHRQLMDAPLIQLGAGGTAEDPWGKVVKNNETLRLAEELFAKYDEDGDGYWSLNETTKVQKATEGTEMQEEAFNALIIAAAPDGGRKLTEEDLSKGLSRQQVIELYTDATRQRQLGFVLDVYKDHDTVFSAASDSDEAKESSNSSVPADTAPIVD